MKMQSILLGLCLMLGMSSVYAASIAIDTDASTVGAQSTFAVDINDTFTVDIFVDIGISSLQGYELDVGFDNAFLRAISIVDQGFLTGSFGTLETENDINTPDVNLTRSALGTGSASGSGILARITFQALLTTTGTALDLKNVILSTANPLSPFLPSVAIPLASVGGASITINPAAGSGPTPVPVPAILWLVLAGFLILQIHIKRIKS